MSDLSQDACPGVRLALARNSEVLPSFLETLSEDGDRKVRSAARDGLRRVASASAAAAVLSDTGATEVSTVAAASESPTESPTESSTEGADGGGGVLGRLRSMFRGK